MANGQNNKLCFGKAILSAEITAKRENNIKYLYPGLSIAFVLMVATVISIFFINKFYKKRYGEIFSPYKIAFVCLISEVLVMLFLNSLVKTITFEVNYWVIFFAQLVVFFIDVPLNTFVVEGLLLITQRLNNRRV